MVSLSWVVIETAGYTPNSGGSVATQLRFKNANNNVNNTQDPMVRPVDPNINYSWEKCLLVRPTGFLAAENRVSTLEVAIDTNSILLGGSAAGVTQIYAFRDPYTQPVLASSALSNTFSTTRVSWNNAIAAHEKTTHGDGNDWSGADFLYTALRITSGNGGELTSWNMVAYYAVS